MANRTYRALICCPIGIGSSAMLQIKVDQVVSEEDLPIVTVRDEVEAIDSFDGDLIITMADFADRLATREDLPPVVGIRNIVDKREISDALHDFLGEH